MKTIDIGDAVQPLADYARDAVREPLVVTERNKPIAAVVPLPLHREGGADYETLSLRTNLHFLQLLDEARARIHREGGISFEEMCRRLGLDEEHPKRTTSMSGAEAPWIRTKRWNDPDPPKALALRLRNALQGEVTSGFRYVHHPGSDSVVEPHSRGATVLKVVPFDPSMDAVAHLGTGVLLGFRAEDYDSYRRLNSGNPGELSPLPTPYRIGYADKIRDFYILPLDEANFDASLPHVVTFVRLFLHHVARNSTRRA